MASNPTTKVSAQEYLAIDRAAEFRSELLDGEIVAMSGGSLRHSRLQANLISQLHAGLSKTDCQEFTADLRVRVTARTYVYPDVTIVCGKPLLADERQDILLNPKVIFEVLSPSTEYYDRGVKFHRYREIESLTDYIMVDQGEIWIDQLTRGEAPTWTLREHRHMSDVLSIASIGVSLPVAAIYDRVELPAE